MGLLFNRAIVTMADGHEILVPLAHGSGIEYEYLNARFPGWATVEVREDEVYPPTGERAPSRAFMEVGHCLDNASKTAVTLQSGEQCEANVDGKLFKSGIQLQVTQEMIDDAEAMYGGNVAAAAEEWRKLEPVPPERVVMYAGGVWEALGAEAVENAARGIIDFVPRRDCEHMRSECHVGSIVAHKSRCAYCGALTVDDSRGNCGACGGPR